MPYAIVGLVILLPSSWLPRWAVAVLGEVSLVPAVVFGGGFLLIPSMFLIDSALVRYGVVDRAENAPRAMGVFFAVSAAIAIPTLIIQARDITSSGFSIVSTGGGTRAWRRLHFFSVAGLAYTDSRCTRCSFRTFRAYGANQLHWCNDPHAHWRANPGSSTQHIMDSYGAPSCGYSHYSRAALWLRHYTQGPLEYLWRWVTWGSRSPFLIRSAS